MNHVRALLFLFLVSVAALSLAACGGTSPAPGTPTPQAPITPVKASTKIISEGKVIPVQSASLAFQTGGLIAKVPVALGENVTAGQVLAVLDTSQLELQLKQADANLAVAQAKLDQLKRGPTEEEVAAAHQSVASAQATYDSLLHPSSGDLVALKADVDKTQALLSQAQAAYDRVGGDSNPYSGMLPQRAELQSAWIDHQKALSAYNARLKPTDAQVQESLATVQSAKAQLVKLQPTAEDVAAAAASVTASQAARDLIAAQIKNASIIAPLAGTITSLDAKPGEYANPGSIVIRLADGKFQVETTDLTELNVASVHEGDSVSVSFDALSDLTLPGRVAHIKGYGENHQGDIVYTLIVALDNQDPRLRWNMTAKVSIEPKD